MTRKSSFDNRCRVTYKGNGVPKVHHNHQALGEVTSSGPGLCRVQERKEKSRGWEEVKTVAVNGEDKGRNIRKALQV